MKSPMRKYCCMRNRDLSAIDHIRSYCKEVNRTLSEIGHEREKFNESSTHRNALALCVLQIGELVGILTETFKEGNPEIP